MFNTSPRQHYLFMLSKCVLAVGHRLPWREILLQVRSRLRRWSAGDLFSLWMEAVDIRQTMSRRLNSSVASPSSQRNHNARRARRAVQDGLHSKALTSVGRSPSPEVLRRCRKSIHRPLLPPYPLVQRLLLFLCQSRLFLTQSNPFPKAPPKSSERSCF
jgi:hypothetical protein